MLAMRMRIAHVNGTVWYTPPQKPKGSSCDTMLLHRSSNRAWSGCCAGVLKSGTTASFNGTGPSLSPHPWEGANMDNTTLAVGTPMSESQAQA